MSELAKMRDYLGPGGSVITAAAIEEVTSQGTGVEPEVWAVTDALGERNLEKALAAMKRFEGENGFEVSDEDINIGISVKKGNTELKTKIDAVLSTMTATDFNTMMAQAIAVQPLSE
jgi:hypothetical protein